MLSSPLGPAPGEIVALRSAMRDVQVTIGDYYEHSAAFDADPDELATRVRANVSFVQVLNDLLSTGIADSSVYKAMFNVPEDPRTEIIRAFKYVRNVMQHILHPVLPETSAVVGGSLGFRTYAVWQEIPSTVHDRLHKKTRALRPLYDLRLKGREVTGTMLDAAAFFAAVCPDIVHTRTDGEWTGFPLLHQPGVPSRLHPDEPADPATALAWLSARRPGGDARVVCGCLNDRNEGQIVFGFTFTRGCAFAPFFETVHQVEIDVAFGYRYYEADVAVNTFEVNETFGLGDRRSVFCSKGPIDLWLGAPLDEIEAQSAYVTFADTEWWRELWAREAVSNAQGFITRRERRLNASVPR